MASIAMIVSNRYDPDPRVQKEAASLARCGHRVVVYAFDRACEKSTAPEILEGVEVRRLQVGQHAYGSMVEVVLGMRRFLGAVRQQLLDSPPDVVHCHDQDTCPVGLWWKSTGRGKFVFDAHEFYWTYLRRSGADPLWRRAGSELLRQRDRHYARGADLVITVTEGAGGGAHEGTAETYRRWGCDPLVLWNAPRRVPTAPPLPDRFTVGYLGAVRDVVMFEWLLGAIDRLAPAQRPAVRIAGAGVASERVRQLVEGGGRELGIDVRVSGGFSMDELPGLMAECSAQYCMYSLGDGNVRRAMPVKLLDSIAHGRPVIGNAGTLMGDWIERHDWGCCVAEGDIAGLADALLAVGKRTAPLGAPPLWEDQEQRLAAAYDRLLG